VFDTSTVNIDPEHPSYHKIIALERGLNDSIEHNNNDSSIVVAQTIEHPPDPNAVDPSKPRKSIGHYFIGNLYFSNFIEKSIGEGTFGKVKLGTH
jgi:hypothetical protein